jgi:hypothetical protein
MGESEIAESGVGIHGRPKWNSQAVMNLLDKADEIMNQPKPLSRSSRIAGRSVWNNRGPASFTGAARAEALDEIQEHPTPPANPIIVEVIDDDSPNEVKTITVVWRYEFECLSRQPGSND